jgi:hypothetical protein
MTVSLRPAKSEADVALHLGKWHTGGTHQPPADLVSHKSVEAHDGNAALREAKQVELTYQPTGL